MPVTPTYPGVYIEEIPSGVRTITAVATSITAFVGRTKRGPDNKPITVNGYAEFERVFGGLWEQSRLAYAVRDFFMNGGGQAVIVRLFNPVFKNEADRAKAEAAAKAVAEATAGADIAKALEAANAKAAGFTEEPEKSAAATVEDAAKKAAAVPAATVDSVKKAAMEAVAKAVPTVFTLVNIAGLSLQAAYPGSWGERLRLQVDVDVSQAAADEMGVQLEELFNLTVRDTTPGGRVEQFRNLTVKDKLRRIDRVLATESDLVKYVGDPPSPMPTVITDAHKATTPEDRIILDGVSVKEKELAETILEKPNEKDAIKTKKSAVQEKKEALKTSDGNHLDKDSFIGPGKEGSKSGLFALEDIDLFNILCLPPYKNDQQDVDEALVATAAVYCEKRRSMLLVDPPSAWGQKSTAKKGVDTVGTRSKNAALFFPRLKQPDPLKEDRMESFVPCGAVAGIFARTDVQRGVWKAPAGLDATLFGVPDLTVPLTDAENGELNPLGINCLRSMPAAGRVAWGSRTLQGDDRLASEWKYISVRRTALFIEESLYRGTQWVVFEPNDEPLWAQIRLNLGAFMHNLFRQGAFQGSTPRDAYFVKCDKESTTQNDINLGIVNIVVGFAPLKPAEFVIIKLQQMAGQIQT